MSLQNAFGALALDTTSQAIRDRLPALLDGDGGLKVHIQNQTSGSVDVTDRVGRLLGHVTIDNASLAVTQSGSWSTAISGSGGSLTSQAVSDAASPGQSLSNFAFNAAYNGTTWDRVRSSVGLGTGVLRAGISPDVLGQQTGTLTIADAGPWTIPLGAAAVTVSGVGTALSNASVAVQISVDGGTTWTPFVGTSVATTGGLSLNIPTTTPIGSNTTGAWSFVWEAGLPALPSNAQLRLHGTGTSITGGTYYVTFSSAQIESVVSLANAIPTGANTIGAVALNGSTNQFGFARAVGSWHDDTTTTLGGNGTFTSTTKDLSGGSAGAGFSSLTTYGAQEIRGRAVSDVVGTLFLEVSRDNFVTARRVKAVAMSNLGTDSTGTGTVYVAEILHRPATRYARWVFVNGAGAQTYFELQTFLMSA